MSRPQVSVVVTAFNRRRFLTRAIQSVGAQDFDRDSFEVFVSTNFQDDRIEEEARAHGFQLLKVSSVTAGLQIAEAVSHCQAPVIALLDDDDTWAPTRLRRVHSWFQRYPRLQYYANTYTPVDENGQVDFGKRRDSPAYNRWLTNGMVEVIDPQRQKFEGIDRLFRVYPGNNSSIAVNRALIEHFQPDLARVRTSIDHFLLVAALLQGGPMVIEHVPLTVWQKHSVNTSRLEVGAFHAFEEQLAEVADRIGSDNRVFLDMAERSGIEPVIKFLGQKLAALNEIGVILSGGRGRSQDVRLGWLSLTEAGKGFPSGYWASVLTRARVTCAVSPQLARVVMYLFLQRESPD